jgi:hypothetical protein
LVAWAVASLLARAEVASSAHYELSRHAFTAGLPTATSRVASAGYVLTAASVGGISRPAITSAVQRVYSGFLVPWDLGLGRPDLTRISIQDGRVWLEWARPSGAVTFAVESAASVGGFSSQATGLTTNRWDAVLPAATSRYFRVKAIATP